MKINLSSNGLKNPVIMGFVIILALTLIFAIFIQVEKLFDGKSRHIFDAKTYGLLLEINLSFNDNNDYKNNKDYKNSNDDHDHHRNDKYYIVCHIPKDLSQNVSFFHFPSRFMVGSGSSQNEFGQIIKKDKKLALIMLEQTLAMPIQLSYSLNLNNLETIINRLGGIYLFDEKAEGLMHVHGAWAARLLAQYLQDHDKTEAVESYIHDAKIFSDLLYAMKQKMAFFSQEDEPFYKQWIAGFQKFIVKDQSHLEQSYYERLLALFEKGQGIRMFAMLLPVKVVSGTDYSFELISDQSFKRAKTKYWQHLGFVAKTNTNELNVYEEGEQDILVKQSKRTIKVEILNASGIYRQAKHIRDKLAAKGFSVIKFSNYPNNLELERSAMLLRNHNALSEEMIAPMYPVIGTQPRVVYATDLSLINNVTFVIGKDYIFVGQKDD